ncbi:hypothetical protein LP414_02810 [Polaromonas sp. P1(28)-13]|nr:hypothetical protein LP417_02790 [Polaromonas sp. P1-6]UUZ76611.1 hypothetical protein LP414_02810 [Polaromonas sp. P1(28)-13]
MVDAWKCPLLPWDGLAVFDSCLAFFNVSSPKSDLLGSAGCTVHLSEAYMKIHDTHEALNGRNNLLAG